MIEYEYAFRSTHPGTGRLVFSLAMGDPGHIYVFSSGIPRAGCRCVAASRSPVSGYGNP